MHVVAKFWITGLVAIFASGLLSATGREGAGLDAVGWWCEVGTRLGAEEWSEVVEAGLGVESGSGKGELEPDVPFLLCLYVEEHIEESSLCQSPPSSL